MIWGNLKKKKIEFDTINQCKIREAERRKREMMRRRSNVVTISEERREKITHRKYRDGGRRGKRERFICLEQRGRWYDPFIYTTFKPNIYV